MRKLASFDDQVFAQNVRDVLHAENIPSEVRSGEAAQHSVWIVLEEDLDRARSVLSELVADPSSPRFTHALRSAQAKRLASTRLTAQRTAPPSPGFKTALRRSAWHTPITFVLIVGCFVVALATDLAARLDRVHLLSIVDYVRVGSNLLWDVKRDWLEHLQFWRIWTPIFIHFGVFHLLFNVWYLIDLAQPVERKLGSTRFAALIFWSAALSDLAQLYVDGPAFGGMSGVIYALVGYLWIAERLDPFTELRLRRDSFAFLMGWLVVGFTGVLDPLVGSMANYCHLGGLLAGGAYAYLFRQPSARRLQN